MINAQEKWLSIGEVVEKLKGEYQNLTKSMIRFWEKEELLTPARSRGGHRKYSEQDIERMKIIVELRQKRYLPLPVVKHIILRLDQDPTYDLQLFDEVFRPEDYNPGFQPIERNQAAQETGVTIEQLNEVERLGFLPSSEGASTVRMFDEDDLQVLHIIKVTLDLGFAIADLHFYVEDIKKHVRKEAEFWKKARKTISMTEDRKYINRRLLHSTRKLRSLLYRKYGGLEVGGVLENV